jgi:hypothetical protein
MIKLGGKSHLVLTKNCSKNPEQNFLNFTFLHLAIFSLIFNPFLNSLLTKNSFQINANFSPCKNAYGNQSIKASAAKVAGSTKTLGFYADLKLSIEGTKTNTNTSSSTAVASNINSNGNLIISSGMNLLDSNSDLIAGTIGNTTITGSNISSTSGDIKIAQQNLVSHPNISSSLLLKPLAEQLVNLS